MKASVARKASGGEGRGREVAFRLSYLVLLATGCVRRLPVPPCGEGGSPDPGPRLTQASVPVMSAYQTLATGYPLLALDLANLAIK